MAESSGDGNSRSRFRHWRWWVCAAVVAVVVWRWFPLRPLPAHTGDGEFTDITVRGRLCIGGPSVYDFRGFSMDFPAFDMTIDHHAEYPVARLPEIGRTCQLYLAIEDPKLQWQFRDEKIRQLGARLRLELIDGQGDTVTKADGALSEWVWGFWKGRSRLYQMYTGEFSPARDQQY